MEGRGSVETWTRQPPMVASSIVLGFQRRENHEELEEEGDEDAEYEIVDPGRAAGSLLDKGVLSDIHHSELDHEKQAASASLDPHPKKNQNMLEVDRKGNSRFPNQCCVMVPMPSSFTAVQRVQRRRKLQLDDTESELWEQQLHDGVWDHTILGFHRMKNEEDKSERFGEQLDALAISAGFGAEGTPKQDNPNKREIRTSTLPDDVVEKIVSMIPFPDILNSRALNKFWRTNFTSSPAFQKQVAAVSSKWKHYCPIILNSEEQWLMGFDHELKRWQKMGMKFEGQGPGNWFSTQRVRGAGCLMCGTFSPRKIFVTNILTRTWKWLPTQPVVEQPKEIHLLLTGPDSYRVLLITKHNKQSPEMWCQIYDSQTKSWNIKKSLVNTSLFNSSSAFLDGSLYVMEYDPDDHSDVMKLLAYNVEAGTWTNIPHPFGSLLHEIETYELLVCQSHVMVVIQLHPVASWFLSFGPTRNIPRNTIMVYKLDPVSLEVREVARGPPHQVCDASSTLFASDNDCIYFGNPQVASSSVLVLNVRTKAWSCLPPPPGNDGSFKNKWATFPFQPGLNPFVSV